MSYKKIVFKVLKYFLPQCFTIFPTICKWMIETHDAYKYFSIILETSKDFLNFKNSKELLSLLI